MAREICLARATCFFAPGRAGQPSAIESLTWRARQNKWDQSPPGRKGRSETWYLFSGYAVRERRLRIAQCASAWVGGGGVFNLARRDALEAYSRSAAAELGPLGITVSIVSPGPVQTGYISPQMEEELVGDIPLRRVGQPRDIADAIVFLASEQAAWITGQLLCVHGGHRMSLGL